MINNFEELNNFHDYAGIDEIENTPENVALLEALESGVILRRKRNV